jgi:hypothetical protein
MTTREDTPALEIVPVTPEGPRPPSVRWPTTIVDRFGRAERSPRCDRHNRSRCPCCA